MGARSGPATYWPSALKGPTFPCAKPPVVKQTTSPLLVTTYTRSPSTVAPVVNPRPGQSFTLPAYSFGTTNCQRKAPVFSSRHNKMLRSPLYFGLRGESLLVPIKTLPPDTTGFPYDWLPSLATHLTFSALVKLSSS